MKVRLLIPLFVLSALFFSCSPSLKIAEYAVTENSAFLNNKIKALPLEEYEVKILRIKRRGEYLRSFDGNTKIMLNDTLYLLGTSGQLEKIYRYFDRKN